MTTLALRRIALLAVALPLVGAVGACSGHTGCTDEGSLCGATTITALPPDGGWVGGSYGASVSWGTNTATCTIQMPASPPTGSIVGSCTPETSVTSEFRVDTPCRDAGCVGEACAVHCSSSDAAATQLIIVINTMPSRVDVALTRDGGSILTEVVMPQSTTTEPNGSGCGTCTNSAASIVLGE